MIEEFKRHKEQKEYVKIYRNVGSDAVEASSGYMLDFSESFLLLQESDNFRALGYAILPIKQIIKVRFNRSDKYYDKIIKAEKEIDNFKIDYVIDLNSWNTIFESIKRRNLNVIIECEASEENTFIIGPITNIDSNKVCIQYFDATGLLDKEPTCIEYKAITKLMFDDRYINILSKYTRCRKS